MVFVILAQLIDLLAQLLILLVFVVGDPVFFYGAVPSCAYSD